MQDAVGPVLRMSDALDLVVQAIVEDNPGQEIEVVDNGAYVRVQASAFLRISLAALQRKLGPSFQMRQFESMLSAFAGRIATSTDEITWSLGASKGAGATGKGGAA